MPSNVVAASAPIPATLRRLPSRATEPPFDDETPTDSLCGPDAVQGTLALAFALPGGLSAIPGVPGVPELGGAAKTDTSNRRLSLVPPLTPPSAPRKSSRHRRSSRDLELEDFGPQRTPRALLPEPKLWAARLVQAIVEVTAGVRPVGQLIRWTTTDVYESMQRRIAHAGSVMGTARRAAAIVRSVHVTEPSDGVAEVCAVVQQGARCRAIALRLEGVDGRWQCTALQVC